MVTQTVRAIRQKSTESPLAVHAQLLHDAKIGVGRNTPLPQGAFAYMVNTQHTLCKSGRPNKNVCGHIPISAQC